MKSDKPHGQWVVLHALTRLPPFGVTATTVEEEINGTDSGTRTRLKELADMGLVLSSKTDGDKFIRYWITQDGWRIAAAGTKGLEALRAMRNTHATLENERAIELAPIREKWQHIIENRMRMIALSMLGSAE